MSSRWFSGSCHITGYEFNELLGTKLRALYQRKKGRDLLDLALALESPSVNPRKIIEAFHAYMAHGNHRVTQRQFEENLAAKLQDRTFIADIGPLLAFGYEWNIEAMAERVARELIMRLES